MNARTAVAGVQAHTLVDKKKTLGIVTFMCFAVYRVQTRFAGFVTGSRQSCLPPHSTRKR
jgi:hypothetical protein